MSFSQTGLWISGAKCPHLIPKTSHCLIRYTALLPDYYRITGLDQFDPATGTWSNPKPLEYGGSNSLSGI